MSGPSVWDGLPVLLALWLTVWSLLLFCAMAWDKRQAVRGGRRVPEKRLFLLALLGGGIGGFCGMYVFRHKTRHWKFVLCFPLLALLQAAGCVYLTVRF